MRFRTDFQTLEKKMCILYVCLSTPFVRRLPLVLGEKEPLKNKEPLLAHKAR